MAGSPSDVLEILQNSSLGDFLSYQIQTTGKEFLIRKGGGLGANLLTFLRVAIVFSTVVYGIRFILGDIATTGKQYLYTLLFVLLSTGITQPDFYVEWVFTPVFELKENLTSYMMLGSNRFSVYESFDIANSRMFTHAKNIMDSAGWNDVSMILVSVAIYLIYGLYYLMFLAITLFCDLSLCILLTLGVLILPLSAFQTGRGLFKAWCVAILKYVASAVILGLIISLLNALSGLLVDALIDSVYQSREVAASGDLGADDVGLNSSVLAGVLAIGAFGIYLMFQAMEFASELTGGVMSSGGAGVGAIANSAKGAMNAGGMAKGGISQSVRTGKQVSSLSKIVKNKIGG